MRVTSTATIRHRCPHECGCKYVSKRLADVNRHARSVHQACNPECPSHGLLAQKNTKVETSDSVSVKQVEHRNQPTVQVRQGPPTVQEPVVPDPKPRNVAWFELCKVTSSDEEKSNPDYRGSDSNEESDSDDPVPPPTQAKLNRSGTARSTPERFAKAVLSHSQRG